MMKRCGANIQTLYALNWDCIRFELAMLGNLIKFTCAKMAFFGMLGTV